jgi:serine/threonine-protein kinase RsbW
VSDAHEDCLLASAHCRERVRARQLLDRIFTTFGVRADCREEIAVAVSEACSNAVRHAEGPPNYELAAESDDSDCVITVNDDGPGTVPKPEAMPAADAMSGRGIALIRVTTDDLELQRRGSGGLSVRMFKKLRWTDNAIGGKPP